MSKASFIFMLFYFKTWFVISRGWEGHFRVTREVNERSPHHSFIMCFPYSMGWLPSGKVIRVMNVIVLIFYIEKWMVDKITMIIEVSGFYDFYQIMNLWRMYWSWTKPCGLIMWFPNSGLNWKNDSVTYVLVVNNGLDYTLKNILYGMIQKCSKKEVSRMIKALWCNNVIPKQWFKLRMILWHMC